jgi:hypothetical protein
VTFCPSTYKPQFSSPSSYIDRHQLVLNAGPNEHPNLLFVHDIFGVKVNMDKGLGVTSGKPSSKESVVQNF